MLSFEIQARQSCSLSINSIFENDLIELNREDDGSCNPAIIAKINEYHERSKKIQLRKIQGFAEPRFIGNPLEGKINYKKPVEVFPRRLWDTRPYIQPIKEVVSDRDNIDKYPFRENVDTYTQYPAISINLDFSDEVILSDIKKNLLKLRKRLKHKPTLMPPKEFIKKFKNFRTLQVIDILLWQKLTEQHIQYETLAEFLFPQGQFSGKQLRETIIPFAKKLINDESNESKYLFYLSEKSSEK